MIRLLATEGAALSTDPGYDLLIRTSLLRLQRQLTPRVPFLTEENGRPVPRNLVGTIALREGLVLEVTPKVGAGDDWVSAVLDLLTSDRIDVSGSRRSGTSPEHAGLLDALATLYSERLRRALQRDGPLLVLDRVDRESGVLRGRLRHSAYLRAYPIKPHRFPVTYDVLSADNDFSRAMALVARALAGATSSHTARATLLECAAALRPGAPPHGSVSAGISSRPVPVQWAVYQPAWSIASSILARTSLLRPTGAHHGLEVVLEAWPLLETLLRRVLEAAATAASAVGRDLKVEPKQNHPLLSNPSPGASKRHVEPDGELSEHGQTVATFEAKYSRDSTSDSWPPRDHVFQSLSTAAARHSPLAVLVYPGTFDPVWWDVDGFSGHPARLAAVGLRMFSYRRGVGEHTRADDIVQLLAGRP